MKRAILLTSLFLCLGFVSSIKGYKSVAAEEEVSKETIVAEYNFDDYKGLKQGHSDMLFDNVSGWNGFSCVTVDPNYVINGCASYRIKIPTHSAWKQAAVLPLPSGSETYTIAFKYRMINGDGSVKLGGDNYEQSSNIGLGFNSNGDANHNIMTNACQITPMGSGVWSLSMVVTPKATDKYVYFSSLQNGGEYIIDDLVILKGNKLDEVTFSSNMFFYPSATKPIQTVDFESDEGFVKKSEKVNTSIINNGINGKSIKIDFTNTVSDFEKLISKEVTLEPNTYYTVNFKLNHLPTWDRWFHIHVSNKNIQLVDYYMNLFTAVKDGYGYDNAKVTWSDNETAQYFTVGFYTDDETTYDLSFSCGTPYGYQNSQIVKEMFILIDDVRIFKGPAYYELNKSNVENGSISTNKESYYFGENASISYNANNGYQLQSLYVGDTRLSFDHNSRSKTIMIENSYDITANFISINSENKSFALAPVFTDNMVLQRGKTNFSGYGENGETINVTVEGYPSVSTVVSNGTWELSVENLVASSESKTVTVTGSQSGTITLKNVLIGEVWYCSGQSNMEWWVGVTNGETYESLAKADYSNIRYLGQENSVQDNPCYSYAYQTDWKVIEKFSDCNLFSAVALSYAVQLSEKLKIEEGINVPVGIIEASVGGSSIEQWLPSEVCDEVGVYPGYAWAKGGYYNGMVYNLKGATVRGVLWYQGCANIYHYELYKSQFKAYMEYYREFFDDENLPFIMMQLPQYNIDPWEEFRLMQWGLMEDNEGLYVVSGIDLGEKDDIHPKSDKYEFAQRAVDVSLKYVYDIEGGAGLSPYPNTVERVDKNVVITLNDAKTLNVNNGNEILGFEALIDDNWVKVNAILENNKIIILDSSKATRIRYLYAKYNGHKDVYPFIYNEYDLPVTTFDLPVSGELKWEVNVNVGDGQASITNQMVKDGEPFEVTITPPQGKEIACVKINGEEVSLNGNLLKIDFVNSSTIIDIEYKDINKDDGSDDKEDETAKEIKINVNIRYGEYEFDKQVYKEGENALVTFKPNFGYELFSVMVDGVYVSDSELEQIVTEGLKLNNLTKDVDVVVAFTKIQQEPTQKGCNGSIVNSLLGMLIVAGSVIVLRKKRQD